MEAGRELDTLVAEEVLGWKILREGERWVLYGESGEVRNMGLNRDDTDLVPRFSIDIGAAWRLVEKLAPLAGDFHEADGFFKLLYGDSGDHGNDEGTCNPGPIQCDEATDRDLAPWSAHFHPGHPGEGSQAAELWPNDPKWFCARGSTAAHAICLAALKACGVTE